MKRTWLCLVICTVVLWMVPIVASSYSPGVPQASQEPPVFTPTAFNYLPFVAKNWRTHNLNTIIIIWDGTQRAHLLEMLERGELPNLEMFIDQNAGLLFPYIDSETCSPGSGDGYRTQTGPANSAIATGLGYPGMMNWKNSDPHPIPDGLTLWEWSKELGYITGFVSSVDFDFWPHIPLSNAKAEIDYWKIETLRSSVTERALWFIRTYASSDFFLWVHYKQPDGAGHEYGENSPQYSTSLVRLDQEFSRLLQGLRDQGIEHKTLLVLTTDHGFIEDGDSHTVCTADTKNLFLARSDNGAELSACVETQTDMAPCIKDTVPPPE